MLHEALMFFVSRQWVEVDLVRSALGMWVWAALLRRETLSIPAVVFQFTRELAGTCSCWWPSARREVRAMAAVLPLMWADVGAPISNLCLATDACGATESHNGAYGIVAAVLPAAMTRSIFEAGTAIGFTVPRADGDLSGLRRPEKALAATKPHTTLSPALFDSRTSWSDIEHGRWAYADHITLGECRAVVRSARLLALRTRWHRARFNALQDNRPTSGACTKGRSPSPGLNFLLRQKAAACLAAGIRLLVPWVESALQPADDLSRL